MCTGVRARAGRGPQGEGAPLPPCSSLADGGAGPTSQAGAGLRAKAQRRAVHPSLVPGTRPGQRGDSASSLRFLFETPCVPQAATVTGGQQGGSCDEQMKQVRIFSGATQLPACLLWSLGSRRAGSPRLPRGTPCGLPSAPRAPAAPPVCGALSWGWAHTWGRRSPPVGGRATRVCHLTSRSNARPAWAGSRRRWRLRWLKAGQDLGCERKTGLSTSIVCLVASLRPGLGRERRRAWCLPGRRGRPRGPIGVCGLQPGEAGVGHRGRKA